MITNSQNHRQHAVTARLTAASRLSAEQLNLWSAIQRAEPELGSPFFRPEFTQAIAKVRNDVEVAVLYQDNSIAGFFPFHRSPSGAGLPVGQSLSDFQGVIAGNRTEWTAEGLLRDTKLSAWHFNHMLGTQEAFRPYHWLACDSPFMDLSGGFESYRASRKMARSDVVAQTQRKGRKLQREVGTLRLVPHATDTEVLEKLLEWKTDQYRHLKVNNYLAPSWTRELISNLIQQQDEAFAGMLSAVYAGDDLVAVHFGIRSYGVLHWWFPTYNPQYSKYSPGLVLLLELAKSAESLNLKRIDLGRGEEPYKARFMSGATPLGEGSVDLRPFRSQLRKGWWKTREMVRNSPLKAPVQQVIRNARGWWLYGKHSH